MISLDIVKTILGPVISPLIKRIPNPAERQRTEDRVYEKAADALTAAMEAQTRINEKEAQHASLFVAGWRPALGWVCAIGLGWAFIIHPLLSWVLLLAGVKTPLPPIEWQILLQLILALLGLGGYRTIETLKGVARNMIPKRKKGV